MEKHRYKCHYCGAKYIPKRRHVQKYCSNSCRVNAFKLRNKSEKNLPEVQTNKKQQTKDKMSWSGVGNAAAGVLATNLATSLFTKEENKPATKGDIQKLLNAKVNKIILIKNMSPRIDGARAYFDTNQQILIYKK